MNRFTHLLYLIFFVPCCLCAKERPPVASGAQPNIILIMADDMGYSDIGCYGGEIETPNIDRLAAEGIRFRQFYNHSKCTTTRASMMSGRYPNRGKGGLMPQGTVTLAEVLQQAGYRTILSGKWHLGSWKGARPMDRGFDESYGLFDGCSSFFYPTDPDKPGFKRRFFGHNDQRITEFPEDFYATDAFTDHALDQIRQSIKSGQPYFLHIAHTAPHYPLHALPEDIAKYEGRYAGGWETLRQKRFKRMTELGVIDSETELPPMDAGTQPWTDDPYQQRLMEIHAAMVDRMDQNIGRVLELLDETGTADNTLIIFLSDNGASREYYELDPVQGAEVGARGSYRAIGPSWASALNTPFRKAKLFGHEGGICTPCVVRWPTTVPAGDWTDAMGHVMDFMPTLMAAAGLDASEFSMALDGENLMPVLQGKERDRDAPLFMEWAGHRSVRDGDWKLVWERNGDGWELYEMKEDRTELNDLSSEHPERVSKLAEQWKAWATRTGVKF